MDRVHFAFVFQTILFITAKGGLLQQKIGSDNPHPNAAHFHRHANRDGTVTVRHSLPQKEYVNEGADWVVEESSESVEERLAGAHEHLHEELVHHEAEVNEEVLAKHVNVPVGLSIIGALFLGSVVARRKMSWLPESAITIALGVILGTIMKVAMGKIPFFNDEDVFNEFCSTLLNLFLLPILMFEAGWSMRYKDFASQFQYIMLFAVVGSLISFLVVGFLIYQTGQWGLHSVVMPRSAFAYASLIAATDPVATLATYTELKVDPLLNILVFGDSIFNDAVAIVLFKVLNSNAIMGTVDSRPTFEQLTKTISFGIFSIFFGSVAVGFAVGGVFLLAMRLLDMRTEPRLEVLSLIVLSFTCFSFAEAVEMSGIIATMFCSILVGIYGRPHLSDEGSMLGSYFLQQLARLMDTSIFLLIGFCTVNLTEGGARFGVCAMVFCLCGRAASVFPVAAVCNSIKAKAGSRNLISSKTMFMMWHAGLRGAISLTLSMQLGAWVDDLDGPGTRHIMQSGTYLLIIVFLFVFGGSTHFFLEHMEIPMEQKTPPGALYQSEVVKSERDFLAKLNDYLMPVFVGSQGYQAMNANKDYESLPDVEEVLAKYKKTQSKNTQSMGQSPQSKPIGSNIMTRGPNYF